MLEVGKLAEYSEEGWIALVNVLDSFIDGDKYGYRLEVVETLEDSSVFKSPEKGQVFDCSSTKGWEAYTGWSLEGGE